jgi:hypothetical protein
VGFFNGGLLAQEEQSKLTTPRASGEVNAVRFSKLGMVGCCPFLKTSKRA